MYYFLCSEKFCVENRFQIGQVLNFIEQKLSGPFWSMSSFTTGLLLLICFLSRGKGKLFPTVLDCLFLFVDKWRAWGSYGFVGDGKGAVMLYLCVLREPQPATFADSFNSTIYSQSSITNHAANTKIPHLLCERTYCSRLIFGVSLKACKWSFYNFLSYNCYRDCLCWSS